MIPLQPGFASCNDTDTGIDSDTGISLPTPIPIRDIANDDTEKT